MGDRAVITIKRALGEDRQVEKSNELGVYLHWHGSMKYVKAFLKYCKLKGYRTPESDDYGYARLCQVIGNCIGGGLSLGINTCNRLDCNNGDNGVYIIDNWEIVDKVYNRYHLDNTPVTNEELKRIDMCQPKNEQFGEKFWESEEVDTSELMTGDEVYIIDWDGKYTTETILGILDEPKDYYKRGKVVKGKFPYVGKYSPYIGEDYKDNRNNWLTEKTYRRIKV